MQRLDPNLEVYITNTEETQLTQIDVVIPCEDYGENADDHGEFIAIFPKSIPNNSNLEKLEYRNLSHDTANCDKFTLTAEEVKIVSDSLEFSRYVAVGIVESMKGPCVEVNTRFDNLLTRIKQWQNEHNK